MVNHGWGYWKWSIYDKNGSGRKRSIEVPLECLKQAPKPQTDPQAKAKLLEQVGVL